MKRLVYDAVSKIMTEVEIEEELIGIIQEPKSEFELLQDQVKALTIALLEV